MKNEEKEKYYSYVYNFPSEIIFRKASYDGDNFQELKQSILDDNPDISSFFIIHLRDRPLNVISSQQDLNNLIKENSVLKLTVLIYPICDKCKKQFKDDEKVYLLKIGRKNSYYCGDCDSKSKHESIGILFKRFKNNQFQQGIKNIILFQGKPNFINNYQVPSAQVQKKYQGVKKSLEICYEEEGQADVLSEMKKQLAKNPSLKKVQLFEKVKNNN